MTLKRFGDSIAPHVCHMINCIVRTSTFPSVFKITKIIPILKSGKPADEIDSYRPINCLPTLKKLVEQWFLLAINGWIEESNLISHHHHGGRQNYYTQTAKLVIEQNLMSNMDKKYNSVVLATDLSAAFDTVDHLILLRSWSITG